jgi:hypothetical protein
MDGETMKRARKDTGEMTKVGPFRLTLQGGKVPDGPAHDCLVMGTRKTVGFTFYKISEFDLEEKKVQGAVTAVVWMPRLGAEELYRQLGEALLRLEQAREDEVVQIDYSPRTVTADRD